MKKQFIIGFIFFALLFLFTGRSQAQELSNHKIATQSEDDIIAHGKYMFDLAGCVHCHTSDKKKPLAGGYEMKSQFGTFFTPNITPDKKTGLGNWSEAQFLKSSGIFVD